MGLLLQGPAQGCASQQISEVLLDPDPHNSEGPDTSRVQCCHTDPNTAKPIVQRREQCRREVRAGSDTAAKPVIAPALPTPVHGRAEGELLPGYRAKEEITITTCTMWWCTRARVVLAGERLEKSSLPSPVSEPQSSGMSCDAIKVCFSFQTSSSNVIQRLCPMTFCMKPNNMRLNKSISI